MNALVKRLYSITDITSKLAKFYSSNKYVNALTTESTSTSVNVINIRNTSRKGGKFDDAQILWYSTNKFNVIFISSITVDPSKHFLTNPINKKGTAIVVPNQYMKGWISGLHRGNYDALVQNTPFVVIRDNNKDDILDISNTNKYSFLLNQITKASRNNKVFQVMDSNGKLYLMEQGMFGINCHRASSWKVLDNIGLYSAGCTTYQDPKQYAEFIRLYNEYNNVDYCHPVWVNIETLNKYL